MAGQNKPMKETMKNHFHLNGLQSWIMLTFNCAEVMNWVLGILPLKYCDVDIK